MIRDSFLKLQKRFFDIKKYRFTEKNRNSIKDLKKIIKKFKKICQIKTINICKIY